MQPIWIKTTDLLCGVVGLYTNDLRILNTKYEKKQSPIVVNNKKKT